jgi:cation transporter-like permease
MIVGGLKINVDPDDYFEPLFATLMDKSGTKDILAEIRAYDEIPKI